MKVLVGTSIWSISFRRKQEQLSHNENLYLNELKELISEVRAVIIGPIRQEILSGISNIEDYELLKDTLAYFKDNEILTRDYEFAAKLYNTCRKNGIQGSHIDFLICAVASNNNFSIYTSDKDFYKYQEYCDISLHTSRFHK